MRKISSLALLVVLAAQCGADIRSSRSNDESAFREDGTRTPNGLATNDRGTEDSFTEVLVEDLASGSPTEKAFEPAPIPSAVVYLNGQGGTYIGGRGSDSRTNRTALVDGQVQMPPFSKGAAAWQELVTCVKGQFSRFNVEITDQDPGNTRSHIEAVVSGTPQLIGEGANVGGVSPVAGDCSVLSNAINFSFEANYRSIESLCKTVSHEVGHALGLEHEYYCPDPMTYLSGCGPKTFQDFNAPCGENAARNCRCRNPLTGSNSTQNSVQHLLRRLGPAGSGGTTQPPAPPQNPGSGDRTPPMISIVSPENGATVAGDSIATVVVRATDDVQLADVLLHWSYRNQIWSCGNTPGDVSCTRSGNEFTFRIPVGTGERTFFAEAVDAAGNRASTATRVAIFEDGPNQMSSPDRPNVMLLAPSDGDQVRSGSRMRIEAQVEGEGISTVLLHWTRRDGRTMQLEMQPDGENRYFAPMEVSGEGTRGIRVSARDSDGDVGYSDRITIRVR